MDGHPITARPSDFLTRWGKWVLRNPASAGFLGVLCLVFTLLSQMAIADLDVFVDASMNVVVIILASIVTVSLMLAGMRPSEFRYPKEFIASVYSCLLPVIGGIGLFSMVIRLCLQ